MALSMAGGVYFVKILKTNSVYWFTKSIWVFLLETTRSETFLDRLNSLKGWWSCPLNDCACFANKLRIHLQRKQFASTITFENCGTKLKGNRLVQPNVWHKRHSNWLLEYSLSACGWHLFSFRIWWILPILLVNLNIVSTDYDLNDILTENCRILVNNSRSFCFPLFLNHYEHNCGKLMFAFVCTQWLIAPCRITWIICIVYTLVMRHCFCIVRDARIFRFRYPRVYRVEDSN